VDLKEKNNTMRHKSFLHNSLRLDGITKLLHIVSTNPMYFSELFINSKIKFKASFLKYLRYCVENDFITKFPVSKKNLPDRYCGLKQTSQHYMFYKTTDKGKEFLNLLNIE